MSKIRSKKTKTLKLLDELKKQLSKKHVSVVDTNYSQVNQQVKIERDIVYSIHNTGYSNIVLTITIYNPNNCK